MDNPLDANRFLGQPCAVLGPVQLTGFNITKPGTPDTDSQIAKHAGPACTWKAEGEPFRGYGVAFMTGNTNGLADIYRGHDQGIFDAYFEPTTVDGYPAVFNDGTDGRPSGRCNMTIGITDTLTFQASLTADESVGATSCAGTKELAAAVVATLKAGG